MKSGITAVTYGEMANMKQALSSALGTKPDDDLPENMQDAVIAVIAAFYRTRYGPAAGSTAIQSATGKTATRYYDSEWKTLRWLVLTNPEKEQVTASREDKLDGTGPYAWTLNERPWSELVYSK